MSRQQDQERLEQAIKDAEARLRVFRSHLEGISKELRELRTVEMALEENLHYLKQKTVITMAGPYRKAKEDLVKTRARMALVKIDYDNVFKAAAEVEEYLTRSRTELAKSLKDIDNVIPFRRKDEK